MISSVGIGAGAHPKCRLDATLRVYKVQVHGSYLGSTVDTQSENLIRVKTTEAIGPKSVTEWLAFFMRVLLSH